MSFELPITINDAIERIKRNNFLLPAIQREFVWSSDKIERLFDSLLKGYPISSFLFWKVETQISKSYKFYQFISEFRQRYKIHNEEFQIDGSNWFSAVLDGQQRLTSLYIGLLGSYAYKEPYRSWVNTEWSIPTRRLYLDIENLLEDQEDGRIYNFSFLKDEDTNKSDFYNKSWFRIGKILDLRNLATFNQFVTDNKLSKKSIETLARLQEVIHSDKLIQFYEEKEQNLDKALNIFIRINSGGEPLNFSDLLMSIAVANWEKKDARKEIHLLVDNILESGFYIDKDFILKTFLVLHSRDIRFKVTNFSKENAKEFESEWEKIRNAIISVFDLVKTFGFNDYTLTSKNALIPIIYYVYYRNIYQDFHKKSEYKNDRSIIKKWLHIVLVKRIFGSQSDAIITQIRKAFTTDIEKSLFDTSITEFPSEQIFKNIKRDISIGDDYLDELLKTQKDDKYAFSILALLYPALDYKNNDFHKDHLHPESKYDLLSDENKNKYGWEIYNSIYNLQMLDANENMSKQDKNLSDWVTMEIKNKERLSFLNNHLIPDVNFDLTNFDEFITKRKEILKTKLKVILN